MTACREHSLEFNTNNLMAVWVHPSPGAPSGVCRQWLGCYSIHLRPGARFPYRQIVPHSAGARITRRGVRVHDIILNDPGQSLLWLFGHEFFHYLTWTGQISRPDTEQQANLYGLEVLNKHKGKL